jgi:hypothetical protein
MSFVKRLSDEARERLMAVGSPMHLAEGDFLLRRGERNGDLYLIQDGRLEVVDSRQRPEMVLDVLGPGMVVGEMAFLDGTPRAADVRCTAPTQCVRWVRAELNHLLERDPALAAQFFRSIGESVVERVRVASRVSVGLGVSRLVQDEGPVPVAVSEKAREIADVARSVWFDSDQQLREDEEASTAIARAHQAFSVLVEATDAWLSGMTSAGAGREAGGALRKELRPYLVRTHLGRLAIDTQGERAGGLAFQAHLLLNRPRGSDVLGEALDAAFLALPTAQGLRARLKAAVEETIRALPDDRPGQVTILQPGCGALLANLSSRLVQRGATITVVDGDRESLAFVDSGQQARPSGLTLRLVHEDLVGLSEGRSRVHFDPQDVIIVDGLLDHLPERLAGTLIRWCSTVLAPQGVLLLTAMAPCGDARVIEHLLGWPLVRRRMPDILNLMESAGLEAVALDRGRDPQHAGMVLRGQLSVNGQV